MYRCLRYRYRYDYFPYISAANTMVALVASLEDVKLSCTIVSYNGTDEYMIIPPLTPLQIKY